MSVVLVKERAAGQPLVNILLGAQARVIKCVYTSHSSEDASQIRARSGTSRSMVLHITILQHFLLTFPPCLERVPLCLPSRFNRFAASTGTYPIGRVWSTAGTGVSDGLKDDEQGCLPCHRG